MILLSDSDVRSVLNAAARTDEVRSQRGAVEELLRATASLVRCDRIFWTRLDATGPVRKLAEIGLPQEPWPAPWDDWLAHLGEHPIMSQRHGAVTSVSDVFTRREFRETWLYHEAFRPAGIAHEIGVQLSHPVSEIHTIVISRSPGSDFTDRDHLVL